MVFINTTGGEAGAGTNEKAPNNQGSNIYMSWHFREYYNGLACKPFSSPATCSHRRVRDTTPNLSKSSRTRTQCPCASHRCVSSNALLKQLMIRSTSSAVVTRGGQNAMLSPMLRTIMPCSWQRALK